MPEIQIRRQPSLQSIIRDVVDPDPDQVSPATAIEYDLFISHATEDKAGIVRSLVQALQQRQVNVWYDEFELRIGDSLRRKIDQGSVEATSSRRWSPTWSSTHLRRTHRAPMIT